MQLDDDRPRAKRRDDDDRAQVCDWCGEPYARQVPLDGLRAVCAWLATALDGMELGHHSCVYSACCGVMPRARTDLARDVRAVLEAQCGEMVRCVPRALRCNKSHTRV